MYVKILYVLLYVLIVDAIVLTLHFHLILGLPQEQLESWIHRRWIHAMC